MCVLIFSDRVDLFHEFFIEVIEKWKDTAYSVHIEWMGHEVDFFEHVCGVGVKETCNDIFSFEFFGWVLLNSVRKMSNIIGKSSKHNIKTEFTK